MNNIQEKDRGLESCQSPNMGINALEKAGVEDM